MDELVAWVTAITSVLVLVTTVLTARAVVKVHILVNSKFTAKLDRIELLTEALVGGGVEVPEDHSDV